MAERTALIPARWWADEQAARSLLERVDASEQGRASVVLGLHALLGGYLAPLREATLVDRALIHRSIEQADLEPLEDAVSKAFGQSDLYSHLAVQDLRRRAQQGADRSMVVFSTLPAPVAVDRAVAAAGVPGEYLGPYWNTVKTPGVLPLVRDDAADRALMAFAQKYAASSPVAKAGRERFREEDVSRDEDGKFAEKGSDSDTRRKKFRKLREINRLNDQYQQGQRQAIVAREQAKQAADEQETVRRLLSTPRKLSQVKRMLDQRRVLNQTRELGEERNEGQERFVTQEGKRPPAFLFTQREWAAIDSAIREKGYFTTEDVDRAGRDYKDFRSGFGDVPIGTALIPEDDMPADGELNALDYRIQDQPITMALVANKASVDFVADPRGLGDQIALKPGVRYGHGHMKQFGNTHIQQGSVGTATTMFFDIVEYDEDMNVIKADQWDESEVERDEEGRFAERDGGSRDARRAKWKKLRQLNALAELNRPQASQDQEEDEAQGRTSYQRRRMSHQKKRLSNPQARVAHLEEAAQAVAAPTQERVRFGPSVRYKLDGEETLSSLFGVGVLRVGEATKEDGGFVANIRDVRVTRAEDDSIPEKLSTLEDESYDGVFTHLQDTNYVLKNGVVMDFSSLAAATDVAAKLQGREENSERHFDVVAASRAGNRTYRIQYSDTVLDKDPLVLLIAEPGMIEAYHSEQDVTLSLLDGATMAAVITKYPDAFPSTFDGMSLLRPVQVIHARIGTS